MKQDIKPKISNIENIQSGKISIYNKQDKRKNAKISDNKREG